MDNPYKWFIIGELIIIGFIVIAKIIFNKLEDKKIDKIIEFMDKKSADNRETKDKFEECLKIIEKNKEIDKNGKPRN